MLWCHNMSQMMFILNYGNYYPKVRACATNEESDQGVVPWCWNGSSHCNPESSKGQQTGLDVDWAKALQQSAKGNTNKDCWGHGCHSSAGNHPIACSSRGANALSQHLRPVLILLPVCCSHRHRLAVGGHIIAVQHLAVLAIVKARLQVLVLQVCHSCGIRFNWAQLVLTLCWWPPQGPEAPKQTNQGRPGRKKWWRPRTLACVGSAARCHTHVGVAIPWPCCSHPQPTWSQTCWNLQSSDCDSRCNFYCAKWLPQNQTTQQFSSLIPLTTCLKYAAFRMQKQHQILEKSPDPFKSAPLSGHAAAAGDSPCGARGA